MFKEFEAKTEEEARNKAIEELGKNIKKLLNYVLSVLEFSLVITVKRFRFLKTISDLKLKLKKKNGVLTVLLTSFRIQCVQMSLKIFYKG